MLVERPFSTQNNFCWVCVESKMPTNFLSLLTVSLLNLMLKFNMSFEGEKVAFCTYCEWNAFTQFVYVIS